jgi:hypothetical protein
VSAYKFAIIEREREANEAADYDRVRTDTGHICAICDHAEVDHYQDGVCSIRHCKCDDNYVRSLSVVA